MLALNKIISAITITASLAIASDTMFTKPFKDTSYQLFLIEKKKEEIAYNAKRLVLLSEKMTLLDRQIAFELQRIKDIPLFGTDGLYAQILSLQTDIDMLSVMTEEYKLIDKEIDNTWMKPTTH